MRTTQVKVYKYDELSDGAKEKARDWFREGNLDYEWWDGVYEDAATIGDILGINLRTRTAKLMNGKTRQEPAIGFSGFSSQGDGAHFEGSYEYAKGSTSKIREYAPKDTEIHNIADGLQKIQAAHFYKLTAHVKHRGHYQHENCTDITVILANGDDVGIETEDTVKELLRDFMRWIYARLEQEYDYLNSDEQVEEMIEANEYEFTEDGEIA